MTTATNDAEARLGPGRLFLAVVWFGGLLVVGVVSHATGALRTCASTQVTTATGTSSETTTDAAGAVTTVKSTNSLPSDETTRACTPIGVGELAVVALPGLALLRPILKGFSIAGLFGVDFKEVTAKAAKAAEEQTIRLIIASEANAKAEQASVGVDRPSVTDLPTA